MKCVKCGAELKTGCIYCSVCGKEAQIVSDYNLLEDDFLRGLLSEEEKEKARKKRKKEKPVESIPKKTNANKKKNQKLFLAIGLVIAAILITTITILLIKYNQRNSFDYQRNKGIAYEEKKEYEKAEKYFEQALKLEKENLEVKHRLVEIYLSLEERDSAIDMLKDIISLDSSDMDAMQKLIELYAAVEEYDEIQKLYIKTKDSNAQKLFEGYAVSTPVFETDPGTYKKKIMLTLSCQENCKIYYTQDGSNPVKNGIEYTKEIELTEGSVTIRAVSCNQHDIYSEEIEGTYTIAFQAPETPKVIPDSGKFNIPQNITVEVPKGCRVYYTWDGSIPTVNNTQYTEPIEVPEGNNILSLIVINEHDLCSNILKCNYIYIPE